MPVLDSSFLIDVARGHPQAREALRHLQGLQTPLYVPTQAALEFATGTTDEVLALAKMEATFTFVSCDRAQVLAAARLGRAAIQAGRFRGWGDLHIAALAALHTTYVVTADPRRLHPTWDRGVGPPQRGPPP